MLRVAVHAETIARNHRKPLFLHMRGKLGAGKWPASAAMLMMPSSHGPQDSSDSEQVAFAESFWRAEASFVMEDMMASASPIRRATARRVRPSAALPSQDTVRLRWRALRRSRARSAFSISGDASAGCDALRDKVIAEGRQPGSSAQIGCAFGSTIAKVPSSISTRSCFRIAAARLLAAVPT